MIDGMTCLTFCLVIASKRTVSWRCGDRSLDRRNGGWGNIHEQGGIDHPPVTLTAKPTSDENYKSKGQPNDLFEDIQKLGVKGAKMADGRAERPPPSQSGNGVTVTGNGALTERATVEPCDRTIVVL